MRVARQVRAEFETLAHVVEPGSFESVGILSPDRFLEERREP